MYSTLNDMYDIVRSFGDFFFTSCWTGAHQTVRAERTGPPAVPWRLPGSGGLADPDEGQI